MATKTQKKVRSRAKTDPKNKSESIEFEGYCMKCQKKETLTGDVVIMKNGRRAAQALCPDCGTKVTRFLPNA